MHPMRMTDKLKQKLTDAGYGERIKIVSVADNNVVLSEGTDHQVRLPYEQALQIIESSRPEKFWEKVAKLALTK